jgi:hypothetical protein
MESSYPEIGRDISQNKRITDENRESLKMALDTFRNTWQA